MAKWILKAVIQKGISFLPFGHRVNYLFQKYVTKGVNLTDVLMDDKLGHCREHLYYFHKYQPNKKDFTVLEIGTGWYPIVPIGMFLAGAERVTTVDISELLRPENLVAALHKFREYHQIKKLPDFIIHIVPERLELLLTLAGKAGQMSREEILSALHIEYKVADARKLDLPPASIDLISSNNTFEHIYPVILKDILKEFRRVSKPGGLMSHFIDLSDHFAHLDKSINIYHFLKYTDAEWKLIDNNIQPQNRCRLPEFRAMYYELNIEIIEEINRPGSIHELQEIKLAPRFEAMSKTEVAVSHTLLISRFR